MWPFGKRDRRLSPREPFPPDWISILRRNMPLYNRLGAADREELHRLMRIFLSRKDFEGCGGMTITDEVRVTIAGLACLLLLHRGGEVFPTVDTVLVYPATFVVEERPKRGEDGVVSVGPSREAGEAWPSGQVILAWDDVLAGAAEERDGHNVVLHEFAHELDEEDGAMDGTPAIGAAFPFSGRYAQWARVFSVEYQRLRRDAAEGRRTVLDGYGAENPAEFFAVATETFFEEPVLLKQRHPKLYEELADFYRQDPAKLYEGSGESGVRNSG
jgi:Mlc titration factor MtfA (ptsG expression regulator)